VVFEVLFKSQSAHCGTNLHNLALHMLPEKIVLKNSTMVDTLINKLASISMTIYVQLEKKFVISFPKVLFILPRHSSQYATARVKLAKHRVEPQDYLTFCLVKRKKVTLYLKVITQCFDLGVLVQVLIYHLRTSRLSTH
jgi:hypothetical protein